MVPALLLSISAIRLPTVEMLAALTLTAASRLMVPVARFLILAEEIAAGYFAVMFTAAFEPIIPPGTSIQTARGKDRR